MVKQKKHLTAKQKEVLDFISFFISKHGYSPAYKDIASFLKTKNLSTAQYHIEELEKKGYIERNSHVSRGISPSSTPPQTVSLLGYIATGKPIEPIENPETITIPTHLIFNAQYPHYALKVKGDSMMDMGILDNDTVLIKHQLTAKNGDVVVAITEKGATLKVYKKRGDKIMLEPKNKDYPIIYPKKLEIRGKFVGLIRNSATS